MNTVAILCCGLFFALPSPLRAQARRGQETPRSVRHFVQEFYDWYVPKVSTNKAGAGWAAVLKLTKPYLSPELALQLQEDADTQAKFPGEVVALDFDPFLASQDPEQHYKVSQITKRGEIYKVALHRVVGDQMDSRPAVIADVTLQEGHWRFLDFRYPEGRDLLGVLKVLKQSR